MEEKTKKKIIRKKKEDEKEVELIRSIIETTRELKMANKNFESAEAELIDYYSYEIKANKAKLDYLIKKIKQKGIVLDTINEFKFSLYQTKVI